MRSAAAALAVLLLLGCDRKAAPPELAVTYVCGDEPNTLDPQGTSWGASARILVNVFETLVTFSADGRSIVPGLAEKWTTSADGRTWTFTLRTAKFHDGTDFDAAAVKFAFDRLQGRSEWKPKSYPYGPQFDNVEAVEATDARTATFRLKAPSAIFLPTLALFAAGIPSPTAVKKGVEEFGFHPVGTGPLKFKEWERGVKVVLSKHAGYWGAAKASMDRLIVLIASDPQTALQKLVRGEAQVCEHITLADVPTVEKNPDLRMEWEESLNVCYLGFNVRVAPYSDVNFRRALAHAIDRKKLNDLAYHGQATAARTIVPPAIWEAPADLELPAFDVAKGKELLAKVALPAGFQPVLWHMTYPRPYVQEPDKVALVLKDAFAALGLDLKLEGFGIDAYNKKIQDPAHPMFLLGWSADYADPDNFLFALLHGDSMGDRAAPSGTNNTFFDDARFNQVTLAAQTELDAAKRKALYDEALRIAARECPSVPLVHVRQMAACRKAVRYDIHPIEYRLWDIK